MKKLLFLFAFIPSFGWATYQPVTGSTVTVIPPTGGNMPISGTVTVTQGTASNLKVDLSGTAANATAIKVDNSAVTQPVSGTLSINAVPTGTNNIGTVHGSSVTIFAPNNNGTAIPVSVSGNLTGNQNVAVAAALPAGTNNVGTVTGSTVTILAANNNGTAIPVSGTLSVNTHAVTQSGTWTVQPGNTQNSTSWMVTTTSTVNTQGALSNNGAAAGTNRVGALIGVAQTSYANGSAYTQGRDVAPNVDTVGNLWVSQQPAMRPASYYATSASATYTTATDLACLPGNASNTVLVRRVTVSCTQTTAGMVTFSLVRRSAANSGGTSASMSIGKDDSTSGAAASAPLVYSAAPTRGTFDSLVDVFTVGCMASATAAPNDIWIENWNDKAKVLRGTAQEICLSLAAPTDGAGTTVTGGNVNVRFEWNETATITP